jgi:multidrug efflux pump subunit AcrA (membrane-fusion protein)
MKKIWIPFAVVASLSFATACGSTPTSAPAAVAKEKKAVKVVRIQPEIGAQYSQLSGILQPFDETVVSFEVAGRITIMNVEIGDTVRKGSTLAQLDTTDYKIQAEKAAITIQSANATIQSASASIQSASATLEELQNGARQQERIQTKLQLDRAKEAYEKARTDFSRIQTLYQQGAVTQQNLEDAQHRLSLAQKDVINAEQAYSLVLEGARPEKRKQASAAIAQAEAIKEQAQATHAQAVTSSQEAQRALAKTTLTAKASGIITEKLATIGQLISAGTPVYRIANLDTLKVLLPVPDREITSWQPGQLVDLSLYGTVRKGKVQKIYPKTNANTGTISVEVTVPNPQHTWYPGQVVKAQRKLEERKALFVPASAVISTGGKTPYVFVHKNGKAVKTPVQVGVILNNKFEILSGLTSGAEVITEGAERLFDGDAIEVQAITGGQRP